MDCLINNYISFLMKYNISIIKGFYLWHSLVFIFTILIMFLSVRLFIYMKNICLPISVNENKNNQPTIYKYNFAHFVFSIISIVSTISMWLILPLSVNFFPIKTDIGTALFASILLIPIIGYFFNLYALNDFKYIKENLPKIYLLLSAYIAFIIAVMSAIILSGTMSFHGSVFRPFLVF